MCKLHNCTILDQESQIAQQKIIPSHGALQHSMELRRTLNLSILSYMNLSRVPFFFFFFFFVFFIADVWNHHLCKILMPESKFPVLSDYLNSCNFWKRLLRSLFLTIRDLRRLPSTDWLFTHINRMIVKAYLLWKAVSDWLAPKSLNTPSKHH